MGFDAGAVVGRLEMALEGWKKSVEIIKKDQESLTGFALRHHDAIQKLGREFTIAGAAIVGAFGLMIKGSADYGDKMDELAQRTGASVEILTGLDGALRKNGASVEDLGMGMKFLSGKMVDANNGNKTAIELFDALKIKITDANGKLRSTTDVLFDVADRFHGMRDGAEKTTAAVDLFGRGAMAIIPTLNLGGEGLRKEADEAQRLGKVLTKEAAKAASDFNDRLVDLKASVAGASMSISQLLMPTVQKIVESIKEVVIKFKDWVTAHPALAAALEKLVLGIGGLLLGVGGFLLIVPKILIAIEGIGAAFAFLAANPIVLVIAGLVALGIAVKAVIDRMNEAAGIGGIFNEVNKVFSLSLMDAAKVAGLTAAELDNLIKKYDGNVQKIREAIFAEKEGLPLKQQLVLALARHGVALEDLEKQLGLAGKKGEDFGFTMGKLNKLTEEQKALLKDVNEILGKLHSGTNTVTEAKRILLGIEGKLTDAYRQGLISLADYSDGMNDLEKRMRNIVTLGSTEFKRTGIDMKDLFRDLGASVETLQGQIAEFGHYWGEINNEIKISIAQLNVNLVSDFMRSIGEIITSVKPLAETFKNLAENITNLWINAMATMVDETLKAGGSMEDAFKNIAEYLTSPSGMIGAIVTITAAIINSAAQAQAFFENLDKDMHARLLQIVKGFYEQLDAIHYKFIRISDETAQRLVDLEKKFGKAGAEARTLTDIMNDTGISFANWDRYMSMATNTLTLMDKGLLDTQTGVALADEQFGLLVEAAKRLGEEGSDALVNFIKTSREMGLNIASVTKYVDDQLGIVHTGAMTAAEGLQAMAERGMEDYKKIVADKIDASKQLTDEQKNLADAEAAYADHSIKQAEEVAALQKQMADSRLEDQKKISLAERDLAEFNADHKGKTLDTGDLRQKRSLEERLTDLKTEAAADDAAFKDKLEKLAKSGDAEAAALLKSVNEHKSAVDKIVGDIAALDAAQGKSTEQMAAEMDTLASQAMAVFEGMIENGASFDDALDSIGPALDALVERQKALGGEGNLAIEKLLRYREVEQAHKDLFKAIDGNVAVLNALTNVGGINEKVLDNAASQAGRYYDQLVAAGLGGDEALSKMGPTLQKIKDQADKYGWTLDENTQRLVDQAIGLGIVKEKQESETDIAKQGFQNVSDMLGKVVGKLDEFLTKITNGLVPSVVTVTNRIGDWKGPIESAGTTVDTLNKHLHDLDWSTDFEVTPKVTGEGETIPGAQHGYVSKQRELVMVHGSPARPEYIIPSDQIAGMISGRSGGSVGRSVSININSPLISTSGLSESDLRRAGEKLFAIIEDEAKRRG